MTVDTSTLPPAASGFGGPVNVRVSFDGGGVVTNVSPVLPNDETPMFFKMLDNGFWKSWDGLTAEQAATLEVDGVTGATYSSQAAAASVRQAAAEYGRIVGDAPAGGAVAVARLDLGAAAAALLLAIAAIAPLFAISRKIRLALLALDVAVLGFWQGMFLSMARIKGWMTAGLPRDLFGAASAIILLAMAFAYPLFGRHGHYCANACPFGASQELAGLLRRRKLALPPRLVSALSWFRVILFALLMASLLAGLGEKWLGLELFSAFAFRAAPIAIVAIAAATVVLAVFTPRPYCRFVCPTGTLMGAIRDIRPRARRGKPSNPSKGKEN